MIQIDNKYQCSGCTACASICTHNAITMQPDTMGFLYPIADIEKCVNCDLCNAVCAFNNHYDTSLNLSHISAYAARHKDMHEIETSRSGAVFIAISDWILKQGGVIYGAGYTDHFKVVHKRATTKSERNEFKGSKYVQSDLNNTFKQIKQDLKAGKIVLFSGTPCQTAGLNAFVGKQLRLNLYLVDIVCHGVPSPYIWRDYLIYLERKYKNKIIKVNFRNKQLFGWNDHKETFVFSDGKMQCEKSFTYLFYKHIMFRKSCSNCPFTNFNRPSDVTIADFWGWDKIDFSLNRDDKGISLILINTGKGKDLFEKSQNDMNFIEVELKNCLQPNLEHPSELHPLRDQFENDYKKYGFQYILKKYGDKGWRYKIEILRQKINTAKKLITQKLIK
ncbi:Coenzyme F420 hydrogenase/dehydrogenase, beta subunit C-terminal domain [Bacteroides sp. ET225]|uniref:Coenzyme F420 hydrogenase/dehydrogenase, beta subunit C-terminal domain n=1 Tax=Bacteroides sp. ET225 TaxID=2972461 RepID=UPI0021ACCD0B|nr:Coenzyme F420 hydrogenase/dehydrogenase, beta subunit C-terminal domain [Bacteroides sp. ET225]MCR8916918.1 Coenzyme F420 hydrogenase/dehydrogenase, beta subunit C-terminal domain [Bacteroides sp. ET225]